MIHFKKMKTAIQKFATGKHIIISILFLVLFIFLIKDGKGHLDMRFGYSPDDAYKIMGGLGISGRHSYLSYLGLDFGIIVFLSITLLLVTAFLLKKLGMNEKWTLSYLLPLARGVFDILENIFIMMILLNYPKRLKGIAEVASIMTQLKWTSMIITMAFIIILAVRVLLKRIKRKNCIIKN